jgi:hypothetical protein
MPMSRTPFFCSQRPEGVSILPGLKFSYEDEHSAIGSRLPTPLGLEIENCVHTYDEPTVCGPNKLPSKARGALVLKMHMLPQLLCIYINTYVVATNALAFGSGTRKHRKHVARHSSSYLLFSQDLAVIANTLTFPSLSLNCRLIRSSVHKTGFNLLTM